jgi:hypothetical protein
VGADWLAWIQEDSSEELAEVMDPDNDPELDDDDSNAEWATEASQKPLKTHTTRNPRATPPIGFPAGADGSNL